MGVSSRLAESLYGMPDSQQFQEIDMIARFFLIPATPILQPLPLAPQPAELASVMMTEFALPWSMIPFWVGRLVIHHKSSSFISFEICMVAS